MKLNAIKLVMLHLKCSSSSHTVFEAAGRSSNPTLRLLDPSLESGQR